MKSDDATRLIRFFAVLFAVCAIAYLAILIRSVLFPFVLGFTLAYILNPLVKYFELRGFRRDRVVAAIYVGALAALAYAATTSAVYLGDHASTIRESVPAYWQQSKEFLMGFRHTVEVAVPQLKQPLEALSEQMSHLAMSGLSHMPSFAKGLFSILTLLFLVPFISFFALLEGPALLNFLIRICPSRHVENMVSLVCRIDGAMGNYIRGMALDATIIGLLSLIGLWAIGMDYALEIALVAGVSGLIPYVGPVVGAILGSAAALYQFQTWQPVVQVLALFAAARFIDDWVLQPVILENAVELHPLLILMAIFCGAEMIGFAGIIFAVPIACVIKVFIEVFWEWYNAGRRDYQSVFKKAAEIPIV
ncbi:MAG: hypothetical protein A3G41_02335 [Elusimicrobia bacterium RIFCSPLOWO2_12_FULL_59_9]|nr:MAG: hypothetical protein A3G41_02335 [Elusimicrobia bacterium RIFCSPLOWO2_12_FULL_59_9]